jgi:hypothetical protein
MAKNKKASLVDKEYIKRCLTLTPEQRLDEMQKLNDFLFNAMPQESKQAWEKLKKAGF